MVTKTTFEHLKRLPDSTLKEIARDLNDSSEVVRNLAKAASAVLAQRIAALAA